jgi:hypothetical protein
MPLEEPCKRYRLWAIKTDRIKYLFSNTHVTTQNSCIYCSMRLSPRIAAHTLAELRISAIKGIIFNFCGHHLVILNFSQSQKIKAGK